MQKDEIKIIKYENIYCTHYKVLILTKGFFGKKRWVVSTDFEGRAETYYQLEDAEKFAKFMIEGTKESEVAVKYYKENING